MHILILGGTVFLGRHLAQQALDAGHQVTLFNRGQTNPGLFADAVEELVGDRDGGLDVLRGRSFDACIDPSGYVPRLVTASAELLSDAVDHYTFVSSISVYPEFQSGMDEGSPVGTLSEDTEEVTGASYGPLKALCEQAAEASLPGRVLNVRAGLIVGPWDPTDRFTYWCERVRKGGVFAAPVTADLPVQVIDARDLARWILHCAEQRVTGTFNATGPQTTLGNVLDTALAVTASDARPVWLPEPYLLDQGIAPWMDLPLWLPEGSRAMMEVGVERALAAGLTTRPLTATITDILANHAPDTPMQAGLDEAREGSLLTSFASVGS